MKSKVLIDTSTFYSAGLAEYQAVSDTSLLSETPQNGIRKDIWESHKHTYWKTKAKALSLWHLIESVILYDEIIIDSKSIEKSDIALNIADKLSGVVTSVVSTFKCRIKSR